MEAYEQIKRLLAEKKKSLSSSEEEKYLLIENLLKDKGAFFKMNIKHAFAIFEFLGITDESEALNLYKNLISNNNFNELVEKERFVDFNLVNQNNSK